MSATDMDLDQVQFTLAEPSDLNPVLALLQDNGLPSSDCAAHLSHFVLARRKGVVVGCVGLERIAHNGLLRSLAVHPSSRRHGLARRLCDLIEAYACNLGLTHLYLLTNIAERFFGARGFEAIDRSDVPSEIRNTEQFRSLCPASATCMMRTLSHRAVYLPKEILPLRDDVPGARMWAAGLPHTMLTYFEIDPNTRFERHVHAGEQITTVVDGELFFRLDKETIRVGPGDVIAIPAGVAHAVFTEAKSARAFDAWSPPPTRAMPARG